MCSKLLHNMILKKVICMISNHIQMFALLGNPVEIFYSVQLKKISHRKMLSLE